MPPPKLPPINYFFDEFKRKRQPSEFKLPKFKTGYTPSYAGLDLGITTSKVKKFYSGLEIRGILVKPRKSKHRRKK